MVAQRMCDRCGRGPFVVDKSGWLHHHICVNGRMGNAAPPNRPLTQDEKLRNAAEALRTVVHADPKDEHAVEFLHLANLLEWERLELANADRNG